MKTTKDHEKTTKNGILNKESDRNIEKYLKGMNFPTEKKHILEQAKKNNAPKIILENLNKLKHQKYHNQSDIAKIVWDSI